MNKFANLPQLTVEFRSGGKAETIQYRDKVTKENAQFIKQSYNCETAEGVFVFQLARKESLPENYAFATLEKGKTYRLALTKFAIERGIPTGEGFVIEETKQAAEPAKK